MLKGFYRFYPKEKWINRNIEIEESLYSELKRISENELDTSINKLIDACVENFIIENIIPKLNKREIIVILLIIRYTTGYHRNNWNTSIKEISELSGINIANISVTLNLLIEKRLIQITKISRYKINIEFNRKKVKENFILNQTC